MNIREQITNEAQILVTYLASLAETTIPAPYELSREINGVGYNAVSILAVARLLLTNVTSKDVTIAHTPPANVALPVFNEYDFENQAENFPDEPPTRRDTFTNEAPLDPKKYPVKPVKPKEVFVTGSLVDSFEDDPTAAFGDYPAQINDAAIDRAMVRDEREIQNI